MIGSPLINHKGGNIEALVTGASGHLGYHIVKSLLEEGYSVRAFIRTTSYKRHLESLNIEMFYGDILNMESLSKAIKGIDVVFHTAAVYDLSSKGEEFILKTAIDGTKNLFEILRESPDIKKVIYTSSVETIGTSSSRNILLNESNYASGFPSPYSYAKMQSEKICLEMARKYQIYTIICNPSTIIGKDDYKLTPSNKMLLSYARHSTFYIEGGQSLVDVEDVARGHLAALKYGRNLERYILSGENIEIRQLLLLIRRILGKKFLALRLDKSILYPAAFCYEKIAGLLRIEPIITFRRIKKAVNRYNFYDCTKARQELNYSYRNLDTIMPETLSWLIGRHYK